jgi:hypothetical protein
MELYVEIPVIVVICITTVLIAIVKQFSRK